MMLYFLVNIHKFIDNRIYRSILVYDQLSLHNSMRQPKSFTSDAVND